MTLALLAALLAGGSLSAFAAPDRPEGASLADALSRDSLLAGLQQNLEAQRGRLGREIYSFVSTAVVRELDGKGEIKRTDTVVTWQLQRGDSLLRDSTIYTTRKPEKGKKGGSRRESASLPTLGDTSYVFQVQPDRTIEFKPKRPKKGDLAGSLGYDPETLVLTWAEISAPKPKAPVKNFSMKIGWTQWEGMMVPERIWMRAAWKLLLMSGRMEMEIGFSDYRLHR
jgi:hypothetical protein